MIVALYSLLAMMILVLLTNQVHIYRPQTKFAKVIYVYTCLSFCSQGASRPKPRGEVGGSGQMGCSGPHLVGGVCVQAHTWGVGGLCWGDVQAQGEYLRMH